jgi:N-methylhydantoinase A/oxoprolinase/acetone carboxylase beta subunit
VRPAAGDDVEQRPAWFAGDVQDVAVHAAWTLRPRQAIAGPAIVELPTSTVVVPPGQDLVVHPAGSLLLHSSSSSLAEAVARLQSGGTSV